MLLQNKEYFFKTRLIIILKKFKSKLKRKKGTGDHLGRAFLEEKRGYKSLTFQQGLLANKVAAVHWHLGAVFHSKQENLRIGLKIFLSLLTNMYD